MSTTLIRHVVNPTASGVNLVQSAAKDFRGSCTQKFSQCTDPVARIINMLPGTSGGICLMLTASWIGNLANGKSLWNSVFFGGKFNAAAIISIMHNFMDDEVQNIDWQTVRKYYAKQHNVSHVKTGASLGDGSVASAAITQLMIQSIEAGPGAFVSLDISGPGGAHAVGAWNARGSYLFFDPNYGEFSFPDAKSLEGFLAVLVRVSGYSAMFGAVNSDIWRRA
jgi:Yersinia/Haemophilus virulence surface antigen